MEQAKKELKEEREGNEKKWKDYRLENLEMKEIVRGLKDENEELKARQNRADIILDAVAEIPEVAAKLKAHARG